MTKKSVDEKETTCDKEGVEVYAPFDSVGQAVTFYNLCNPARARHHSLFEPESGNNDCRDDFSGASKTDLWVAVLGAIKKTLEYETLEAARAWIMQNLGDRDYQLHVDEIAEILGRDARKISKWCYRITDNLEMELVRRGLMIISDEGKA
jgi:hypothetical protein